MTDPFDACRFAYEQGQRDALAAAVQRVEGILAPLPNTWPSMIRRSDAIASIKGGEGCS